MAKLSVVLLLLLATLVSSHLNATRLVEIVTIVTDVIVNLSLERAGSVYCWFYTAQPDPQPDNLLEMIQQHPSLGYTARFTYKRQLPVRIYQGSKPYRMPTVLIMDLRCVQINPRMVPYMGHLVLKNTYVIIFISRSGYASMKPIWKMLEAAALLKVFFFRTDIRENFYENRYSRIRTYIETFPATIFPDHTRDIQGYQLKASQVRNHFFAMFTDVNTSIGPIIDWISITTRMINASFEVIRVQCTTRDECLRNMFVSPDGKIYDMIVDAIVLTRYTMHSGVRSIVSIDGGLIAPRSRRMEIHELFAAPFGKEVWITIVLLLFTCMLLILFFPNQFHNNLILLTLCSFERIALYRVQRLEKIVAITLIIFFSLLLSAYESLFISFMTNIPRLRDPRTIADLMELGLKLKYHPASAPQSYDVIDERIRPLIQNVSEAPGKLDGSVRFTERKSDIETFLRQPEYFDYETGESKYVTIDYSSWEGFAHHFFTWESPLVDKFRFTQTTLGESGIYIKGKDNMEYSFYGSFAKSKKHTGIPSARRIQVLLRRFKPTVVILGMKHLSPAWIVLAIGSTLSFLASVAELVWCKLYSAYLAGRNKNWRHVGEEGIKRAW